MSRGLSLPGTARSLRAAPRAVPTADEWVQVALPRRVLHRLLRERGLVACELRSLDGDSGAALRAELLSCLRAGGTTDT